MTRVKKQHLIYRGPDGLGGFRNGHAYALRVGMREQQRYLLHPVTQQPWMEQSAVAFREHWEPLEKQPGQLPRARAATR